MRIEKRPYPPGEHGRGRIRESEYLLQLREKQKARRIYGVLEQQFRNYYEEASRRSGLTGENLLVLLETRLDNVVFRGGLGPLARRGAPARRTSTSGQRPAVNIPSYRVSVGDVITVRDRASNIVPILGALELHRRPADARVAVPDSTSADHRADPPIRSQIDVPVQEQLIVELYSK